MREARFVANRPESSRSRCPHAQNLSRTSRAPHLSERDRELACSATAAIRVIGLLVIVIFILAADLPSLRQDHSLGRAMNASRNPDLTVSAKPEPLLVVILGPTASGKSALAVTLAQRFRRRDRQLRFGRRLSSLRDRNGEAVAGSSARWSPHHLLDVAEPDEAFTAGEYSRQARAAIRRASDSAARLPIVVGGTGLYLRALLEGLFPGPQRSEELRERLRARTEQRGSAYLHRVLRRLDPIAAEKIHPNDAAKLIRAIEVCLASRSADERAVAAARARSLARVSHSAHRAESRSCRSSTSASIRGRGRCLTMAWSRRRRRCSMRYGGRKNVDRSGLAGISAGRAVSSRRVVAGGGYRRGAAGTSQLRQAPDDLVPS